MVFQKLTDSDKIQIAIFSQTFDKKQLAEIRALIMRGATPNDAKAIAEQRQIARNELVVLPEKKEEEETNETVQPKAKPARRAKKELKVVVDKDASESDEAPPFSPTPVRKKRGKVKETSTQLEKDITNQIIFL